MRTMGKLSRRKGATGEREVANIFKDKGFPAKRISMMETNHVDKGDVQAEFNNRIYKISVKRGNIVPKYHYEAIGTEDILFTRRDKMKWQVTMDVDTFFELIT